MQQPVKERIAKLREEIAQISEANRLYLQGGKKIPGASDQERRLQRLQEILIDVVDRLEKTMSIAVPPKWDCECNGDVSTVARSATVNPRKMHRDV